MLPPVPVLSDYGLSPEHGFLPAQLPLERLPDPYYNKWEAVVANLQGLILSKRLRGVIDRLPALSTAGLEHDSEWRRAYSLLCFMAHSYIWGGDSPSDRLPPSVTIPLLHISAYLEVPPVATYAAVCLWNFKPLFVDEHVDNLENLATLTTFTGSIDESWFYLVSVAIEARGAPILPLMLTAIQAARTGDSATVAACLRRFAERLDDLGTLLQRMHESCDPHVFYHRIRPFLAGSKNMGEAGLPNGVIYEDGTGIDYYRKYSGGSNAQSSIIQFFDIVLGIEHRATGEKKDDSSESELEGIAPPPKHNFLLEMRKYMPGPHRRFLEDVTTVANIREYVEAHRNNIELTSAYDACLAMLRVFRDKHISIVARYIIVKARESKSLSKSSEATRQRTNIATASQQGKNSTGKQENLRGTGGTSLLPFLKQARDETGEPTLNQWAKHVASRDFRTKGKGDFFLGKLNGHADGEVDHAGLAGTWAVDDSAGGICHY
ncbi:Indolic compounds 2,3-dioxygenase-like protein [Venustampulla echinocandica]|uniref:Indoleamine 2,3-dioxygenase n=1 Tax=Venustampulla echinocandica TaxID=2656787 RepID=A0A370TUD4_9HELO|nr:Indolic compounds 2,3-dioxygenase-like protein [Venustampulla echinocandica]RDL39129.1 Indolic compounds 2,3-dioxygenase-like protein [Venustampulla echinocandica]